jgi:hypothetical protein
LGRNNGPFATVPILAVPPAGHGAMPAGIQPFLSDQVEQGFVGVKE